MSEADTAPLRDDFLQRASEAEPQNQITSEEQGGADEDLTGGRTESDRGQGGPLET